MLRKTQMEPTKNGNVSEAADNENEEKRRENEEDDSYDNARRIYECCFCKRGFTNAQALGGHMNVHRRERAKGKIQTAPSASEFDSSGISNDQGYACPTYQDHPFSTDYSNWGGSGLEFRGNRGVFFQQSSVATWPPFTVKEKSIPCASRSLSSSINVRWGANLSLRIGTTNYEEKEGDNDDSSKDDEIDLELRLGHGP